MTVPVEIGQRKIGDGFPCFVIAEAGSNHNGRLDQAERLVDVAARARADAVKFQFFRAKTLYPRQAGKSGYLKEDRPIYDIIQEMEMPEEWLPELAGYCRQKGLLFLSSVTDEALADRLDPYVPAYKIPSYEMTHLPFLRHVAEKGKPVILSTGTADLEEVGEAVKAVFETGNRQLVLLQCTASYPAPLESLNVRAVATLKRVFGVPAGFSDHSRDPWIGPVAAVAAGANVIEKHFTLSNELPGPDHRFAVEPAELHMMVKKIRMAELVLGSGQKAPQAVEEELRSFARRSIFAIRQIAEGECLNRENVAVLRCGTLSAGLPPKEFPRLLGRSALHPIKEGSAIRAEDFG